MAIQYLDFDLLIERAGDRYRARVLGSPAGEASGDFAVPFTPEDISHFFVQIGQTRSFETQQTRRIREFGQSLFEAVFTGAVRDRLRSSLGEANLHSNGLRIRLRLAGTPELGNLPWEFLYDPGASRFLALSVETPVVRYLETQQMAQPFAVQPPLRILTVICGPQDYPRLDTEQEWEKLQESMRGLQSRGMVDLQRLQPPTLSALQQQLRREQYHILHFVGHGVFSKNEQDGYLLFENALRGGQRISGHDLGTILHDHRPLRLAVLNACEGARASVEDQFAGTAQSLIQQGIPAVIAMQFRITDQASIMLAHEFYGALADGYPVDAALTEARKAIKTEGNDLEWGTPVLYMRTPDGRLFDILGQPAAVRIHTSKPVEDIEKAVKLDQLYTEGLEAFYLGQWESAAIRFQAIVDSRPDYRDASAKLETIHHKLAVQSLESQAKEAEGSANWSLAVEALGNLAAKEPAFPGIAARVANARRQSQLAEMLVEAEHLAQAEKWEAVISLLNEMEKIEPRYPDPAGLRSRAGQAIARGKTKRELESTYNSALQALNAGDSPTALRDLRRVHQLQPGYRETDQLVSRLEVDAKAKSTAKKEKPLHSRVEPAPAPSSDAMFLEWGPPVLFGLFGVFSSLFTIINMGLDHSGIGSEESRILLHWIPASLLSGFIFRGFISRAAVRLGFWQSLQIVGTTLMGGTVIGVIAEKTSLSTWGWAFLWTIYGCIFGGILAMILRSLGELGSRKKFRLVILGWGLAQGAAALISTAVGWGFYDLLGEEFAWRSQVPLLLMFSAFIGSWVTLTQLKANQGRTANRGTLLSGTLGFAVGNLLTTLVPVEAVWGLAGGSSLAFPSRKVVRYLVLGSTVGLAMWLGNVFGDQSLYYITVGGLVGLILGLDTRRTSGVWIGVLLGVTAFVFRFALKSAYYEFYDSLPTWLENPALALSSAIMGAVLAAGWTYLKSQPSPSFDTGG